MSIKYAVEVRFSRTAPKVTQWARVTQIVGLDDAADTLDLCDVSPAVRTAFVAWRAKHVRAATLLPVGESFIERFEIEVAS